MECLKIWRLFEATRIRVKMFTLLFLASTFSTDVKQRRNRLNQILLPCRITGIDVTAESKCYFPLLVRKSKCQEVSCRNITQFMSKHVRLEEKMFGISGVVKIPPLQCQFDRLNSLFEGCCNVCREIQISQESCGGTLRKS